MEKANWRTRHRPQGEGGRRRHHHPKEGKEGTTTPVTEEGKQHPTPNKATFGWFCLPLAPSFDVAFYLLLFWVELHWCGGAFPPLPLGWCSFHQ